MQLINNKLRQWSDFFKIHLILCCIFCGSCGLIQTNTRWFSERIFQIFLALDISCYVLYGGMFWWVLFLLVNPTWTSSFSIHLVVFGRCGCCCCCCCCIQAICLASAVSGSGGGLVGRWRDPAFQHPEEIRQQHPDVGQHHDEPGSAAVVDCRPGSCRHRTGRGHVAARQADFAAARRTGRVVLAFVVFAGASEQHDQQDQTEEDHQNADYHLHDKLFVLHRCWRSTLSAPVHQQPLARCTLFLYTNRWCGLRPKNRSWSWSWSCRSGVVLWNTVLSRSSS